MPLKGINYREYMEKAVDVMKHSIHELREDNKICPSVGAVLVWPDGTLETACRSEFRNGDHAEYTLLERKNGHRQLDGAILFTTLEPCAPGARRIGKASCAERIVNARIKEVWMGVQDPDPQVAGKGKDFLETKGVIVNLFDADLQDEILTYNKDFISQALGRAKEAKKANPLQTNNVFNMVFQDLSFEDLSKSALNYYCTQAKIQDGIESREFHERLIQQQLLEIINGKEAPTGLGVFLFGKNPRDQFPQAGLTATIINKGAREETKDFTGPLILIPDDLESWLNSRFPKQLSRESMVHMEESPLPMQVIRESVINALIHRDYEIQGAKCHLSISEDLIDVKSPGKPVKPVTLELMNAFKAPMLNRNPRLAYIFSTCGLAEERGLGMRTFKTVSNTLAVPSPKYSLEEPYLNLTIYRSSKGIWENLNIGHLERLSVKEREMLQRCSMLSEFSRAEFQVISQMSYRTALRQLSRFIDLDLVEQIGTGPLTRYRFKRN